MPRLAPRPLHLTETQRAELNELLNKHTTPQQIARRAQIILLADTGHSHLRLHVNSA